MKGIRPEIVHFARAMERKMKANEHKNGWRDVTPDYALKKFMREVVELIMAHGQAAPHDEVMSEIADCANYLMMLGIATKRYEGKSSPGNIVHRRLSDCPTLTGVSP